MKTPPDQVSDLLKAHLDQYTRKDGTVVQAHDTKVTAKVQYDHPHVVGHAEKLEGGDASKAHGFSFAGKQYSASGKSGTSSADETPVRHFREVTDDGKDSGQHVWMDDKSRVHADAKGEVPKLRADYEKHVEASKPAPKKPAEKTPAPKGEGGAGKYTAEPGFPKGGAEGPVHTVKGIAGAEKKLGLKAGSLDPKSGGDGKYSQTHIVTGEDGRKHSVYGSGDDELSVRSVSHDDTASTEALKAHLGGGDGKPAKKAEPKPKDADGDGDANGDADRDGDGAPAFKSHADARRKIADGAADVAGAKIVQHDDDLGLSSVSHRTASHDDAKASAGKMADHLKSHGFEEDGTESKKDGSHSVELSHFKHASGAMATVSHSSRMSTTKGKPIPGAALEVHSGVEDDEKAPWGAPLKKSDDAEPDLLKAHIEAYTRNDGVTVGAHDTSVHKKIVDAATYSGGQHEERDATTSATHASRAIRVGDADKKQALERAHRAFEDAGMKRTGEDVITGDAEFESDTHTGSVGHSNGVMNVSVKAKAKAAAEGSD